MSFFINILLYLRLTCITIKLNSSIQDLHNGWALQVLAFYLKDRNHQRSSGMDLRCCFNNAMLN